MRKTARAVLISLVVGAVLLLLSSVLASGYHYMFDGDELMHLNFTYLIAHGESPGSTYFSIYTPVFHWLLGAFLSATGWNLDTLHTARLLIGTLFVIRLLSIGVLGWLVFGRMIGFLAILFYLLDPFATFTNLQIRPDLFMSTLVVAGFVATAAYERERRNIYGVGAGLLFGLASIVSIKTIPGITAVGIGLLFIRKIEIRHLAGLFFCGILIPVVVFLLSVLWTGDLRTFLQQALQDGVAISNNLLYPSPHGNLYLPNNIYIYGVSGKPLTWIFVWLLPMLACAGIFITLEQFSKNFRRSCTPLLMVLYYVVQWGMLFATNSAFVQYYIPVLWGWHSLAQLPLWKYLRGSNRHGLA